MYRTRTVRAVGYLLSAVEAMDVLESVMDESFDWKWTEPAGEPDTAPAPPPTSDPEVLAIAKTLKLTNLAVPSRRMVSVFMGGKINPECFKTSPFIMRLKSYCLERFVREKGGEIVYTTDFIERGDGNEIPPSYQIVKTRAGSIRFLEVGYVFVRLPDRRLVVQFEYREIGNRIVCSINVFSQSGGRAFFAEFSKFARANHYLVGQAAFADGEPIIHSRRYTWNDVVVPDQVRTTIRTHVETFLIHSTRLKRAGIKSRRGIIFSGPPGTGKTLIGKVLADTLCTSFLWVLPRHISNISDVAAVLEAARFMSPVVLLFEDLDLFGEDRDMGKSGLLGELMNQLDGAADNDGIVSIATTNRLDVVERALRNRPGRFDRVVELGLPDEKTRRRLFERLLSYNAVNEAGLAYLVAATDQHTPAQVEELVNTMHLLLAEREEVRTSVANPMFSTELIQAAVRDLGVHEAKRIGFQS